MATANPLPPATLDDDLDVVPLDEAPASGRMSFRIGWDYRVAVL